MERLVESNMATCIDGSIKMRLQRRWSEDISVTRGLFANIKAVVPLV
jgi:hypothetical protein